MTNKTQPHLHRTIVIQPKILYFGTPVILISSLNEDGSCNLAPMSSAWALGWSILLGLGTDGKTFENLSRNGECVLNLPSADMWSAVENLAPLTGKEILPPDKRDRYRYEKDKFAAAGVSPRPSESVAVSRVAECPLQLEALVRNIHSIGSEDDGIAAVEVEIVRVHAHASILLNQNYIDPQKWRPLIYNFRHYFGLGAELGKSFRSET